METSNEKLKNLLVGGKHIKEGVFDDISKEAKKTDKSVIDIIIDKGILKDEQIIRLIADDRGIMSVNLRKEKIDESVLNLIPEIVARSRGVIAFYINEEKVKVGMTDPFDDEILHFIEKKIGLKVDPFLISNSDFAEALNLYKVGLNAEMKEILDKLRYSSLSQEESDGIVVDIVDKLILYGSNNKASDIHVEPYKENILVRFRIDGILHDVLEIPIELSELIMTRIKVLSKMRTDEHRAAQDGKFRFNVDGDEPEEIDVRVSVLPVTRGENVVMRLLSSKNQQLNLPDLGLMGKDLDKVNKAIKDPHGMILSTGPTGSGKTTTLYAILKLLNKREIHVSTIEDPVEYGISGVNQIQVNQKAGLTFAKGHILSVLSDL